MAEIKASPKDDNGKLVKLPSRLTIFAAPTVMSILKCRIKYTIILHEQLMRIGYEEIHRDAYYG